MGWGGGVLRKLVPLQRDTMAPPEFQLPGQVVVTVIN